MLHYLGDAGIEREGLAPIVIAISDAAFKAFVASMLRQTSSSGREAALCDHALYFLSRTCHRFQRLRSLAFRYLVDLADRFPQLLWNEKWCALTYLCIYDALAYLIYLQHMCNFGYS